MRTRRRREGDSNRRSPVRATTLFETVRRLQQFLFCGKDRLLRDSVRRRDEGAQAATSWEGHLRQFPAAAGSAQWLLGNDQTCRHHRTRRVPTRGSGMSVASRREWCRDTLLRTSTVNPSPGDRLSQHSRSRRSDSAQDCRPQPDRQQQDHDSRCSYIQRKGGRARRSVGSGRTPGGAALTAAGLAFCGKCVSAALPEDRSCRSETNRRTLKQLFFHTANPRHRGIATEHRTLRGKQMKGLGGGRVRVYEGHPPDRTPGRHFTRGRRRSACRRAWRPWKSAWLRSPAVALQ